MPTQRKDKGSGAWIPQEIVDATLRLGLRPPSRWKVFLAVLFTWCRYGQSVAFLKIEDIAHKTGQSVRTVKAALKDLTELGLVRRLGRGKLVVDVSCLLDYSDQDRHDPRGGDQHRHDGHHDDDQRHGQDRGEGNDDGHHSNQGHISQRSDNAGGRKGASKLALPKGDEACTSTKCSLSLSSINKQTAKGLTRRQSSAIQKALDEASNLLGDDASKLSLVSTACHSIGLPENTTIREALLQLQNNCDRKTAHTLTGAILALRYDERVQGKELTGPDTTPSS